MESLKLAHPVAATTQEAPTVKERQGVNRLQQFSEKSHHQIMTEHFRPSSSNPTQSFLPRLASSAIRPDWSMRR